MPNNKDNQKTGSQGSMSGSKGSMSGSGSGNDFERQGSSKTGHGGQSGHGGQGKQTTGSKGNIEDDDMTAGGREGQFSDKNRDREGQWSPGSSQSSDK